MVERGVEFLEDIKPKHHGRTYEDVLFDIMSKMKVGDSIDKKIIIEHFWLNGARKFSNNDHFLIRSLDVYKCKAVKKLPSSVKIRSIRNCLIRSE